MNFMKSLLIFCVLVLIGIAGWAIGSELRRASDDRKFITILQVVDNPNSLRYQTRKLYVRRSRVSAVWQEGMRTYMLVEGKSFRVDPGCKKVMVLFGENK